MLLHYRDEESPFFPAILAHLQQEPPMDDHRKAVLRALIAFVPGAVNVGISVYGPTGSGCKVWWVGPYFKWLAEVEIGKRPYVTGRNEIRDEWATLLARVESERVDMMRRVNAYFKDAKPGTVTLEQMHDAERQIEAEMAQ